MWLLDHFKQELLHSGVQSRCYLIQEQEGIQYLRQPHFTVCLNTSVAVPCDVHLGVRLLLDSCQPKELGSLLGALADDLCTQLAEGEELVRPVLVESAGRLYFFDRTYSFLEQLPQT